MTEWKIVKALDLIKEERKRLLHLKETDKEWNINTKLQYRWAWMLKWLAKTDEEHLRECTLGSNCSSCGEMQTEWLECEFSFCDEYGCGMSLCKECIDALYELSRKLK